MGLKSLPLKNEMELALREIPREVDEQQCCDACGGPLALQYVDPRGGKGLRISEDVRIGESAYEELMLNVEAYIRAVTKEAYLLMKNLTKRTTMKDEEIRVAVVAITHAHIDREIRRRR